MIGCSSTAFHAEAVPLLDFYEQRGILVTVDAEAR
jgi:adenylate kinase family enzyme